MSVRRRGVECAERRAAGDALAHHILRALGSRRVRHWALYADRSDEVPMRPLFEAIRRGWVPLLPRITRTHLEFVPVHRWSDLRRGSYGVLEPPRGAGGVRLSGDDVVVVPGLAFDRTGHRVGRGGGFYDRAFGGSRAQPLLIGAGYAFQLLPHVPHDSSDRRVDVVATERGLIWPGIRR